jgi:putative two-component system response regulator
MKILIVDDDPICLEMLDAILTADGHEVLRANDGVAALEMIYHGDIRMVISDWVMPNVDGIDLCKHVRYLSDPSRGYIYFILLTSRSSPKDTVIALSAGADDFLTKPFEPVELRLRVKAAERVIGLETAHLTIFALAKLAESRDPETGLHLERIREYSRILAQQLGNRTEFADEMSPAFVDMIYLTSPLHDIGKVGLPDFVLLKPARLSEREFSIMKQHTLIGAATLETALQQYPTVEYLKMARDIALSHHERYDGTGYPYGLKGEEIPLAARIVALADVYDALVSRRVYKPAFDAEIARSIIQSELGSHFDPRIVQAFLECEPLCQRVRNEYMSGEEEPIQPAYAVEYAE